MLKEKLSLVPNKPGCYLMKNENGTIIYVGKAKKLKNRLSSYFRGTHTGKTARLVSEIRDFEYVVVGSEKESLVLELNLIKKYDPKYNILLRDDKRYPYIELTNEPVPRLSIVRNVNRKRKNQTRIFGPYPNVTAARNTVNLLNRIYPLRKCRTYQKKPCLYYSLGQCLAPCIQEVDVEIYNDIKKSITKLLNGDIKEKVNELTEKMNQASEQLNFEQAKEYRDLISHIRYVTAKQHVQFNDQVDRDILGYYVDHGYLSIQLFFMRHGKLLSRDLNLIPIEDHVQESLQQFMVSFYQNNRQYRLLYLLRYEKSYQISPHICLPENRNEVLWHSHRLTIPSPSLDNV